MLVEPAIPVSGCTAGGQTNGREVTYTVEGTEEVTVPAGTFTALKVRSDSNMEISTGAAPIQSQGVEWLWFVEGIGLVKEELELDGGVAFSNLAEFSIP